MIVHGRGDEMGLVYVKVIIVNDFPNGIQISTNILSNIVI